MSASGKLTVVGAGFIGATTAMRLAQFDIAERVVLTDIADGKAEGVALDINQSRPIEGFATEVVGVTTGPDGSRYEAIAGSQVVVVTAGLPRKPGMSRADLIQVNSAIVASVSEQVARRCRSAPGWTASTASAGSTSACRPNSAGAGCAGSSNPL